MKHTPPDHRRGQDGPERSGARRAQAKAGRSPQASVLAIQRGAGNRATAALLGGGSASGAAAERLLNQTLASGGRPLEGGLRAELEHRFGESFSSVKLHSDAAAAASARAVEARAYTVGENVVFAGTTPPEAAACRKVLAHELAHVIQQRRGGSAPPLDPGAAHERGATAAAAAVTDGAAGVAVSGATGVGVARDEDKPQTAAHAGGEMGERDAAFALGKKGFELVVGPGGGKGHKLTERGFDIVGYNPKTKELWIVDNKASGGTRKVQDASAITKNILTNLKSTIAEVGRLPNFKNKYVILSKLRATVRAIEGGKSIPSDVALVVTNAGGYHTGIGKKLAAKGVRFEDVVGPETIEARRRDIAKAKKAKVRAGRPTTHAKDDPAKTTEKATPVAEPKEAPTAAEKPAPKKVSRAQAKAAAANVDVSKAKHTDFQTKGKVIHHDPSVPSRRQTSIRGTGSTKTPRRGAGLADVLPAAMNALQDVTLRHRVATEMLGKWSTLKKWRIAHPDHVILSVVSLMEWERPDPAGQVARMVHSVEFFHGPTREAALADANRALRGGVGKGWREVGPFIGWIEPTESLDEVKELVEDHEACFIATACYGSPNAADVRTLREFRDGYLRCSFAGLLVIAAYYRCAPPLARFLTFHPRCRVLVRTGIVRPLARIAERSSGRRREQGRPPAAAGSRPC
jgi:hypothetical protein